MCWSLCSLQPQPAQARRGRFALTGSLCEACMGCAQHSRRHVAMGRGATYMKLGITIAWLAQCLPEPAPHRRELRDRGPLTQTAPSYINHIEAKPRL